MVKIRLRRMGTKGRPFYRIVVAKSTAGRDGSFIDIIGTHNPILKDKENRTKLNGEKALKWLLEGAQPTETVAYMLHKAGVLDQFFAQRPAAKAKFKSIDKRTSSISQVTAIDQAKAEQKAEAAKEEAAVAVAEPEVAAEPEAPTEA